VLAAGAAALLGVLTWTATTQRYLFFDIPVMRAVQSVDWSVFDPVFAFTLWLNGPRQQAAGVLVLLLVAAVSLRALPFALVGSLSGAGYVVITELVRRPRPSADLVSVPEHVDGFGFPSGHAAFFLTYTALLVLCVANRHAPRWVSVLAAAVGLALWVLADVQKMASGAHWPSDILGGTLLAVLSLALASSIRWLSDPVLGDRRDPDRQ
jgi:membrane-associated phospholipid phosphatase